MNKYFYFTLIIMVLSESLYSQCDYNKLFPFQHNISRFKAERQIFLSKNMNKDEFAEKYLKYINCCYWFKPDYLGGDSVYNENLNYQFEAHPCFNNKLVSFILKFADDKLYSFSSSIIFKPDELDTLINIYNNISKIISQNFKYKTKGEYSKNNKEVGEITRFYNNDQFPEYLNENVEVYYEFLYNPNKQLTGISLNMESIDLNEVKLDYRSY